MLHLAVSPEQEEYKLVVFFRYSLINATQSNWQHVWKQERGTLNINKIWIHNCRWGISNNIQITLIHHVVYAGQGELRWSWITLYGARSFLQAVLLPKAKRLFIQNYNNFDTKLQELWYKYVTKTLRILYKNVSTL